MRGNRSLVIIALVLIVVVAIAGAVYLYMQRMSEPTEPLEEATPEAAAVETTEIVVAIQNVPRGMQISLEDNAIALQEWPTENLPPAGSYFTDIAEVDGKFARMEIPRGLPVLEDMIGRPGGMLSVSGSAAALFEPDDRVAYAIPFDVQGAIGWAIEPGDRVDVLAALKMKPVYTEFLEDGVRQFTYLQSGAEGEAAQTSPFGRFELLPNGQWAAIYPTESSQPTVDPALLVQMTVQDAVVWHVGTWEEEIQPEPGTPAGATGEEAGPLGGGAAQAAPTPIPVNETREIELVTLLVTREDALVLKYLHEMGADLDLALRPAGMTGTVLQTQPIWFRYILDKYQLPDAMPDDPVGPEPVHPPLEVLPEPTPVPEE
ncbi:MAG: Flp pilus assembly protein CpaB [Anaerolineae bacterium]